MKTFATFLLLVLFSSNSSASDQCTQLKRELQAMQVAQKQIVVSLVNNHESFASSLEEFATVLKEAPRSSVGAVTSQMDGSAQAFRTRGIQGLKMAEKMNKATGDLLARVAACLR